MLGINFFYLGLSLLLIHEMDAIRCEEWKILPLFSSLNEKLAQQLFILLHIPLCYFLLMALSVEGNQLYIDYLDWFFIIHLGLHVLFLKHPKNQFKDWISWLLIIGVGFCGMIDLLVR